MVPDDPASNTPNGPITTDFHAPPAPELLTEDSLLFSLLRGVASTAGEECFRAMTSNLARAIGVKYAVVAEFLPDSASVRALAFWSGDRFLEGVAWTLAGTPCEAVIGGNFSHHPAGLRERFPEDKPLVELQAESYLGVPLLDTRGVVLGHLFVMDTRPMPAEPRNLAIFRVFAARAASELLRIRLERDLAASQDQLRDLFDEAPIAYVNEGLDSRFIRANRAALRILGITPDQIQGTFGKDFVPDTPDAQKRLRDALESIGRGSDTAGVVLELRRRDDGRPVWIQWWSRPDPGGAFTRTMFLDITERVLMEQEQARLAAQNQYLQEEIRATNHFEDIVGSSPAMTAVLDAVKRVAPTDAAVLITGETGTGKELIARAVHAASRRHERPLVKVNCAALPAGLVESELFGHEKGAFSGAVARRIGRFELANHATIFLDEIGELAPSVQAKILRVLQEGDFERIGGSETLRTDVRVIAATNRDLAADIATEKFRADLFYRLNVFPIHVPPLRERPQDIPLLVSFFVTRLSTAVGRRIERIDQAAMDRLSAYRWPGNIRELRNVLERAIILADSPILRIEDADLRAPSRNPEPSARLVTLADAEREHIRNALRQTGNAIAGPNGAARILGVPPSTLRSRMERLGIKP